LRSFQKEPDLSEARCKYSALNIYTLRKFGTLEFRALEGLAEPEKLYTWLKFLENLYFVALEYQDPTTILQEFSMYWNEQFVSKLLGPLSDWALKKHGLNAIMTSMQEGVWVVQDLVYALDWGVKEKVAPKNEEYIELVKEPNLDEPIAQAYNEWIIQVQRDN
jgi:hypothetical protein